MKRRFNKSEPVGKIKLQPEQGLDELGEEHKTDLTEKNNNEELVAPLKSLDKEETSPKNVKILKHNTEIRCTSSSEKSDQNLFVNHKVPIYGAPFYTTPEFRALSKKTRLSVLCAFPDLVCRNLNVLAKDTLKLADLPEPILLETLGDIGMTNEKSLGEVYYTQSGRPIKKPGCTKTSLTEGLMKKDFQLKNKKSHKLSDSSALTQRKQNQAESLRNIEKIKLYTQKSLLDENNQHRSVDKLDVGEAKVYDMSGRFPYSVNYNEIKDADTEVVLKKKSSNVTIRKKKENNFENLKIQETEHVQTRAPLDENRDMISCPCGAVFLSDLDLCSHINNCGDI